MTFLRRYGEGDYIRVWDELFSLGPAVFDEPLYSDARAVVDETMRRVRTNIEYLIVRLDQIGFVFGYDHLVQQTLSGLPTSGKWQAYAETRRWSCIQPPLFLPARLPDELRGEVSALELDDVEDDVLDGIEMLPDMRGNVALLDERIGPVPLALRGWYERVGAVNLYGYHSAWASFVRRATHLMNACDPLQVCALDAALVQRLLDKHSHGRMKHFEFAPDPNYKDNRSGSSTPYDIYWDTPCIDGTLPRSQTPPLTFVQYLRECFRWAGFPGMAEWPAVPTEDLAFLTDGLLPF